MLPLLAGVCLLWPFVRREVVHEHMDAAGLMQAPDGADEIKFFVPSFLCC
jgi:hypothetical protein